MFETNKHFVYTMSSFGTKSSKASLSSQNYIYISVFDNTHSSPCYATANAITSAPLPFQIYALVQL